MTLLLMGLLGTTGCYKNTVVTGKPSNGEIQSKRHRFLLWGLMGSPTYDLQKMCPTGVSRIEEQVDIAGSLVGCVTCGIVMPVKMTVTCAGGQQVDLTADADSGLWTAEVL